MTLAKKQIEAIRDGQLAVTEARQIALCDLALLAVALTPRPLADIDKADIALVIHADKGGTASLHCYGSGQWRLSSVGKAWPDTTLAIPLSALAGLMESPAHD